MDSSIQSNTYQISGYDDRTRGFTRQVEMKIGDGTYQAIFRYERFLLESEPRMTEPDALAILITQLQARGYTQLRSRLHFRGEQYLGNQEMWEEHPDLGVRNPFRPLVDAIRKFWRKDRC